MPPTTGPTRPRRRHDSARRAAIKGTAVAVLAWLTPPAAASQDDGARSRPVVGDHLVKIGDASLTPLTVAAVTPGQKPLMAWPMDAAARVVRSGSRLNRILLVRLDPTLLSEVTRARAAAGVVAFSAVCTHTGCEVGDFLADEQQLYCECHQSRFDPRDGATVTDGPAPRPLPALPLGVDGDGRLVVTAPFTSRPGFEQG